MTARSTVYFFIALLILAPAACKKFDIAGPQPEFAVGDTITLHWRYVEQGDTVRAKGTFDNSGVLQAIEEASGGGVTGRQIVALVSKQPVEGKITLIWARSVEKGADPTSWQSGSKAAVKDSKFEYYNDYVSADSSGNLLMFLDVEVKH